MENLRFSNFELLKIISIFMVLTLHYFNGEMGGGLSNVQPGSFNYSAMYFLESLSIIAVNCFVMVTGYFMIGKTQVKLRKAIDLLAVTVFYGVLFYVISLLLGTSFSIKELVRSAIPLQGAKWFVGSYVILFVLSPFLNMLLRQLAKRQYIHFLLICIISFSIIPTVLLRISYNDLGYGVLSFIMFYCIGAFIKLHPLKVNRKWTYLGTYIITSVITFIASLVLGTSSFAWNYNSIFNLIGTVALFLFFSKMKFQSRIVNYFATFTFAVYLIHTDSSLNYILYNKLLVTSEFWDSGWFILHLLGSIISIFVGCVVIEIMRRNLTRYLGSLFGTGKFGDVVIGQTEAVK